MCYKIIIIMAHNILRIKVCVCLQESDDAARKSGTGVSGVETVHESSTAQVVGVRMHDYGASKDAVSSDE
jgi:hypothetical protein